MDSQVEGAGDGGSISGRRDLVIAPAQRRRAENRCRPVEGRARPRLSVAPRARWTGAGSYVPRGPRVLGAVLDQAGNCAPEIERVCVVALPESCVRDRAAGPVDTPLFVPEERLNVDASGS